MPQENPPHEHTDTDSPAWYEPWFGTKYYHLLYRHRNSDEAGMLIDNLVRTLQLPPGSKTLDLPCGKGRHALALHSHGMDVTAADLSEENILYCKRFEAEGIRFLRHDMRDPLAIGYFDAVFNLFTSFGYFDREHENRRVVVAAAASLRKGGVYVLDFLNVTRALQHLVNDEKLEIEGIRFHILRAAEDGKIVKRINVMDGDTEHAFREEIRILSREVLESFLQNAGFQVENILGDYSMNPFDVVNSPRIIFIARKS